MKIKLMKQSVFLGLSILFIISSCTIEKRVHNSGYHIEWQRKNRNVNTPEMAKDRGVQELGSIATKRNGNIEVNSSALNLVENGFPSNIINSNTSANSSENFRFIKSNTKINSKPLAISKSNRADQSVVKLNNGPKITHESLNRNELNAIKKELKKPDSSDTQNEQGALKVLGWIVLIIGILILLFASILGGLLIMLLGLLAIIAGKKDSNSSKSNENNESNSYSDIVYLKNGSVIKGQILEQVPNVQLKIQTKDGSMFVYKMEEVEKITKEVSK